MVRTKLARRSCWLITKHTANRMDVFTMRLRGDSRALVVFGFHEEAEMFLKLRLGGFEDGWKVRQTSVGELVSILYGPCAGTQEVVLDPVPEIRGEALVDPLSMPRDDFLRFLLGEEVPRTCASYNPSPTDPTRVGGIAGTSHDPISAHGREMGSPEHPAPGAARELSPRASLGGLLIFVGRAPRLLVRAVSR